MVNAIITMKRMKNMKVNGPQFPVDGSRLTQTGNRQQETVNQCCYLHVLHGGLSK